MSLCHLILLPFLYVPLAWADSNPAMTEETYLRDALAKQGVAKGLDKDPELERLVEAFRKEQLARLTLEALGKEGMPDFTARAKELYHARLDKQYRLPLKVRVRVLERRIPEGKQQEAVEQLEAIRADVLAGGQDFKAAVLQHSTAPTVKLTEGDSQWLEQGSVPAALWEHASKLTKEQPYSPVFVHDGIAYLLNLLERQEPKTLGFADVQADIIVELQQDYRKDKETAVLEALRQEFKQKHPDAVPARAGQ